MADAEDLVPQAEKLGILAERVRTYPDRETWNEITLIARHVANGLRTRNGPIDNRTNLGKTSLPRTLSLLLSLTLDGTSIPGAPYTACVYEILRVCANICMDHDENRALIHDAGLLQATLSLLEGYAEGIPPPPYSEPHPLSIPHLKVARTAIGVLLNASLGFDLAKTRLRSLQAEMTIIKLATALYPAGAWLHSSAIPHGEDPEDVWSLRSSLSSWSWRTITELKDLRDESLHLFNSDVLPFITPPLRTLVAPFPVNLKPAFPPTSDMYADCLSLDFGVVEECCMLLESLCLDDEDVRLALARGFQFPAEHNGVACLTDMLDFIEHGDYHPLWRDALPEADRLAKEKTLGICKGAVIKAIVEVAGEERNEDVLWDDSADGGDFVGRMVAWIKGYVEHLELADAKHQGSLAERDDLVICGTLSLGNLARREQQAITIVSPPHSLAATLASPHLLASSTDIKLKHGVLALLKRITQSSQKSIIHGALTQAGIVDRVCASGVWDARKDAMVEVVQMSAISVVKHMCNADIANAVAFILNDTPLGSGLAQILTLVKQSDSVPIKSEGTRILVNVVKTLWSIPSPSTPALALPLPSGTLTDEVERHKRREAAKTAIQTPEYVAALADLVARSGKYPLLINEGVVALTLLSTQPESSVLVLRAITVSLQPELPPPPPSATSLESVADSSHSSVSDSGQTSPVVVTPPPIQHTRPRLHVPRSTLDMLIFVLRNVDNPANYPVEIRVNVCSLLMQLTRNVAPAAPEMVRVREKARSTLERVHESMRDASGKEVLLAKSTRKVLDAWEDMP